MPTTSDLPFVTIVMPAIKTRFLGQAIESVLAQDYPNLEILVLDDGSPDPEMPALLESYAQREPERFRWVRHDNVGQSETINRGMEMAKGEFAGYLSDDDVFRPGAVRRLAKALQAAPDVVLVYPAYEIINENGEVIDTIRSAEYSLVESVRLHDAMVGAGALFRTDAFQRAGGWSRKLRYRADYDFWLKLALIGDFHCIPEPLAAWRLHDEAGTVAAAGVEMSHESVRVVDNLYARDDLPEPLVAVRTEAYRNAFIQAAMTLDTGAGHDPSQRFFVFDRHMPKISEAIAIYSPTPEAVLKLQESRLNDEVGKLREQIAQREELIAYLGRPWWWRLSRKIVPRRFRPWVKNLGRRLKPGPASKPGL